MAPPVRNLTDVLLDPTEDEPTVQQIAELFMRDSNTTFTNKTLNDISNFIYANGLHLKVTALENINIGQPVKFTSYNVGQDKIEVNLADNTLGTSIGLAKENVLSGNEFTIVCCGCLKGFDTTAYSDGEILYLGTNGTLTHTEPTTGVAQPIAFVIKSAGGTNGALRVDASYPKQDADDVRFDSSGISVKDFLDKGLLGPVVITSGTGSTDVNKWTKFATITITSQYVSSDEIIEIIGSGSSQINTNSMKVHLRIKQQSAFGNNPSIDLNVISATGQLKNTGLISATIIQNTPTTIVDLYIKIPNTYESFYIYKIASIGGEHIEWLSNQPFYSSITQDETSHFGEEWRTPTLLNGWVDYGVGFASCQYRKDVNSNIHIKGLIKNGTNEHIFTLPSGYRPAEAQYFVHTIPTNEGKRAIIGSAGTVKLYSYDAGNDGFYFIFKAEQ